MRKTNMIYGSILLGLVIMIGCSGAQSPTAYTGIPDQAAGVSADLSAGDAAVVALTSEADQQVETPETDAGLSGPRTEPTLRERIRETRDSTARLLRRVNGIVQDSQDRRVHRLFNEAKSRWNRAQETLTRFSQSEGKRRDNLLNAFFEHADAARDLATQTARLANGEE